MTKTIKQKSLDAQRVRNEQIAQKESIQAKREEEKKEATLRIKERDARPPSRGRQSMSSTLPLESQLVVSTAKERTRSMSRDGIKSLELGPPRHISKKSKDGQSITNIFSKSAFSPDAEKITITQDPAGGYVVEPSLLSSLLDLDIPNDGKLKAEGRESLTDSERKKFMIQFKAYHKKNEDIKTIRQYKTYILKHNTKFASKTIHRANLYF